MTADGGAVMISPAGEELWRWEPDALPLDGLAEAAVSWYPFETRGCWMSYTPDWMADPTPIAYVNLSTGEVQSAVPEAFAGGAGGRARGYFRYAGGTVETRANVITIRTDSGEEYEFTAEYGEIYSHYDISGDRLLLSGGTARPLWTSRAASCAASRTAWSSTGWTTRRPGPPHEGGHVRRRGRAQHGYTHDDL